MGRKTDLNIEEAAKIMQKEAQYIRLGLQQKSLDFGSAVQKPNGKWSYHLVPRGLQQYMRLTEEEFEDRLRKVREE